MPIRIIKQDSFIVSIGSSKRGPAPEITLAPVPLPGAVAWEEYAVSISATGGNEPYKFSVSNGVLPDGMSLDRDGLLRGTPTEDGDFPITVTATDRRRYTGSQQYSLIVSMPNVVLTPATIPDGQRGEPFAETTFAASGGTEPYRFSISSGALPVGLTLNENGVLSGTPEVVGPFAISIKATDAHGAVGTHQYTFNIAALDIALTPETLPGNLLGEPYPTTNLSASGGAGTYTFAVTSGSLPNGLSLSTVGILSGTTTAANAFSFAVTVTDSFGNSGSRDYTIIVAIPEVVVTIAASRQAACLQDYFTPEDWARDVKKRVVIPAGVEITANNLDWALVQAWDATGQAGSWVGSLTLENNGVISGLGGAGNSGRGGNCIRTIFGGRSGQKLQLVNRGVIRAGGGGGGAGGAGGGGYYDTPTTVRDPASGELGTTGQYQWFGNGNAVKIWWGGAVIYDGMPGAVTQLDVGGWTYFKGATFGPSAFKIWRQQTAYNRTYTNGGAGGGGGRGAGWDAAATGGGGGQPGGTNAGWGGNGGSGGNWGQWGAGGAIGNPGNNGGGAAGGGGGAPGYALTGSGNVQIVENTGQIIGQIG
jgi:Putative Ig domain